VFLLLPKFVPMNPDTIQFRPLSDGVVGATARFTGGGGLVAIC
jgi:hypothetical protein